MIQVELIAGKGDNSLFHKAYHLAGSLVPKNKIFLGSKKDQKCRFCGRDSQSASFRKIAHILPEFMGNKYAFSYYECDSCNEHFGRLEDSLSNFAGILNSFSLLKGKKGYAKFRGNKEDLEVFATDHNNLNVRSTECEEPETFLYDKEKGRIFVDVNQPGYIPMDVYKALVKIAICMLDESKLVYYKKTIQWLLEPNRNEDEFDFLFTVFRKIEGKSRFSEPIAMLFEKYDSKQLCNVPHHSLIIFYGIIAYQIFLPFSEKDSNLPNQKNIMLPLEENLITDLYENNLYIGNEADYVRLVGTEKIIGERKRFSVGMRGE